MQESVTTNRLVMQWFEVQVDGRSQLQMRWTLPTATAALPAPPVEASLAAPGPAQITHAA